MQRETFTAYTRCTLDPCRATPYECQLSPTVCCGGLAQKWWHWSAGCSSSRLESMRGHDQVGMRVDTRHRLCHVALAALCTAPYRGALARGGRKWEKPHHLSQIGGGKISRFGRHPIEATEVHDLALVHIP
jgi:hypothetical protein